MVFITQILLALGMGVIVFIPDVICPPLLGSDT